MCSSEWTHTSEISSDILSEPWSQSLTAERQVSLRVWCQVQDWWCGSHWLSVEAAWRSCLWKRHWQSPEGSQAGWQQCDWHWWCQWRWFFQWLDIACTSLRHKDHSVGQHSLDCSCSVITALSPHHLDEAWIQRTRQLHLQWVFTIRDMAVAPETGTATKNWVMRQGIMVSFRQLMTGL